MRYYAILCEFSLPRPVRRSAVGHTPYFTGSRIKRRPDFLSPPNRGKQLLFTLAPLPSATSEVEGRSCVAASDRQ